MKYSFIKYKLPNFLSIDIDMHVFTQLQDVHYNSNLLSYFKSINFYWKAIINSVVSIIVNGILQENIYRELS